MSSSVMSEQGGAGGICRYIVITQDRVTRNISVIDIREIPPREVM